MSEEVISKSKQKREQRKADAQAVKTKKNMESIISWVVYILLAAVVIGVIVAGIYSSFTKFDVEFDSNPDFSAGLTEEGFVEGANLNKVDLSELENLVVQYSDVAYSEEDCDSQMESFRTSLAYYSTESSLTVEDGSEINLDYVGYMDGEAFEGGSTDGAGTTLTIGSQTYIDTFEEQLIGSHPGDSVTVNVTFPDPYENNPDFAGKEATFECVVNSIKTTPEMTDALVAENFSEYASTVEELRAYVTEVGYKNNLINYLSSYVADNASAKGAPKSYIKHVIQLRWYNDESMYEYYNTYFYQYFGSTMYASFEDYTQMTEEEYQDYLEESAKKSASADITLEAYFKAKGLTVSDELLNDVITTYGGESAETNYGLPFLKQEAMKSAALEHLADVVTVEGK